MDIKTFVKKFKDHPSRAVAHFYINVEKLNTFLETTSWTFHIFSESFLQFFPDYLDAAPFKAEDWEEAGDKFNEILDQVFNQFYVALFAYVETFLDDITEEIYTIFFSEIHDSDLSSTSVQVLNSIKSEKLENIYMSVDRKLEVLKVFAKWDNVKFKDLKFLVKKYRTIRNTIAHSHGKVKNKKTIQKFLPPDINIQSGKIQLTHVTFHKYSDELINLCLEINKDIVKQNPEISESFNK